MGINHYFVKHVILNMLVLRHYKTSHIGKTKDFNNRNYQFNSSSWDIDIKNFVQVFC